MKKTMRIMIIILLLTGCQSNPKVTTEYEAIIDGIQQDLDLQVEANQKLTDAIKELESLNREKILEVEELTDKISFIENKTVMIPETSNWKYQELSGLRKYIGDTGIRAYPSEDSPIVVNANRLIDSDEVLFCRAVVTVASSETSGHVGTAWGIVLMNDYGQTKVGYVPYEELEVIEPQEIKYVESIGTFHLGDRIEKMIGVLDQDYEIRSYN